MTNILQQENYLLRHNLDERNVENRQLRDKNFELKKQVDDLRKELEGKTISSIAGWPSVTTVLSAFERGTLGSVRAGVPVEFRLGVLYHWLLENLDIDDYCDPAGRCE